MIQSDKIQLHAKLVKGLRDLPDFVFSRDCKRPLGVPASGLEPFACLAVPQYVKLHEQPITSVQYIKLVVKRGEQILDPSTFNNNHAELFSVENEISSPEARLTLSR